MSETFAIQPKRNGKGRTFETFALGYLRADWLWPQLAKAPDGKHRPALISYAATEAAGAAFTANLQKGRPFEARNRYGHRDHELELPKSAGYRWQHQRIPGGVVITTALLPDLLALDSGMLEKRISFLFLPPTWWVDREAGGEPEGREAAIASYFAAMLDRRSPLPIINDPGFHRQLLKAAMGCAWFKRPSGLRTSAGPFYAWPDLGGGLAGFAETALIDVAHPELEEFLAHQTRIFARDFPGWRSRALPAPKPLPPAPPALPVEVAANGQARIPRDRGLLSNPTAPPLQLGLFG